MFRITPRKKYCECGEFEITYRGQKAYIRHLINCPALK